MKMGAVANITGMNFIRRFWSWISSPFVSDMANHRHVHQVKTDYLQDVFNISNFAEMIDRLIPSAQQMRKEIGFDTIAFQGISGASAAYILSKELYVPLICIRKEEDKSHYARDNGLFEGSLDAKRYIIVDDFICSGHTVRRIENIIHEKLKGEAKCVGYLMYSSSRDPYQYQDRPVWTLKGAPNYEQRNLF